MNNHIVIRYRASIQIDLKYDFYIQKTEGGDTGVI